MYNQLNTTDVSISNSASFNPFVLNLIFWFPLGFLFSERIKKENQEEIGDYWLVSSETTDRANFALKPNCQKLDAAVTDKTVVTKDSFERIFMLLFDYSEFCWSQ